MYANMRKHFVCRFSHMRKANTVEKLLRPRDISEIISSFWQTEWGETWNFSILNRMHVFDILLLTWKHLLNFFLEQIKFVSVFFSAGLWEEKKRALGWKKIQSLTLREFFFSHAHSNIKIIYIWNKFYVVEISRGI